MSSAEAEKALEVEANAASSNDNSITDLEINAVKEVERDGNEDVTQYLSGLRLGLVVLGLCLAVLLVGLVSIPPKSHPGIIDELELGQLHTSHCKSLKVDILIP